MPQTSLLWLCSEEVWGGTRALKAADSILYENMSMCLLCIAQIGKFGFIFIYIADWYGHWYIFFRILHENWNLFMCVQMWTTVWGWTLGLASNSFPYILLSRTVEVLNRTNRNNKCVSEADKLICLCRIFFLFFFLTRMPYAKAHCLGCLCLCLWMFSGVSSSG